MYVCMYVCIYVCMYIHTYIRMYVCMYAYVCIQDLCLHLPEASTHIILHALRALECLQYVLKIKIKNKNTHITQSNPHTQTPARTQHARTHE